MTTPIRDLSILIPARNEMFLSETVNDILKNMRANTEIIVVLDGAWPINPIEQHERVNIVYLPKSIGQRAATNLAARISAGTYFMKVDAHCSFGEGFDEIMLRDIKPNMTMIPLMKNLHVFDWVCCGCGNRLYQGPTPEKCAKCDHIKHERDIVWIAKSSPKSTSYRVTPELEFKYFGEYKSKQKGNLVETMSIQGSCFMVHRDKYFGLNICDESWGNWGGQGAEVALKTWLSGGQVICNKNTWYAHLFRTQGKDFSFPYPNPGKDQKYAKNQLREIFLNDKWEHAIRPLSWLVVKFAPVPGWHDE